MIKKRMVHQSASVSYISGTLEEFIKSLRDNVERYVPEEFRATAQLDLTRESEAYGDRDIGVIAISWARPETSEEEKARLETEAKWTESRRQQYEQLKKEFGQ